MCSLLWLCVLLQTNFALSYHLHFITNSDNQLPPILGVITLPAEPPRELNLQLELGHELLKMYAPEELFHIVQRLVASIFHLVQQTNIWSKSKKNKKPKYPVHQKLTINPFGNLSFTVGFNLNFQLSNSIGVQKQLGYDSPYEPEVDLRVN